MSNKVFLIDGMALAYRAHFAFIRAQLTNAEGIATGPIMGFANTLDKLIEEHQPTHLAVAWDTHAPTFRHDWDDRYKAQRPPQPDELRVGIPLIKEMLQAWNIPSLEQDGYEADDIIGTLAYSVNEEDAEVFMVTPDKDFMQLVNEHVRMLKPNNQSGGFDCIDIEGVKDYFGVYPNQVIDVLAILGDASDNIPGVPGIGKKGAPKLIEQYGSLAKLLEEAANISAKRQRESLIEYADEARHALKMVTIKTDVPNTPDWQSLEWHEAHSAELSEFFKRMGFRSLTRKYEGKLTQVGESSVKDENKEDGTQPQVSPDAPTEDHLDLFTSAKELQRYDSSRQEYQLLSTKEDFLGFMDSVDFEQAIVIDTETDRPDPLTAKLLGVAFCQKPGFAVYVPYSEGMHTVLKNILEQRNLNVVAHNYKFDYLVLSQHGIGLSGEVFDTMIAAYLVDSSQRLKMDDLSIKYLNYSPIPITDFIGSTKDQKSMADIPLEELVPYACEDADITYQLYQQLSQKLEADQLTEVAQRLDFPLSRVLARMEQKGVAIDTHLLSEFSDALLTDMDTLEAQIFELAGERFNIQSPAQLGTILFEKLGLPAGKKTKTGKYSTNEAVLSKLALHHQVPNLILEYRSLSKLKSTYADALPSLLVEHTKRLHTDYNQCVAATGRLASSNPNLQNIPIRTARSREIRKAFIPEQGFQIMSADYSQIELRVIAHISNDEHMIKAFKSGEDIHARTAMEIFGLEKISDVTSDHRRKAKEVNFGIPYGLSAFGLAQNLGISNAEAKQMIEAYFDRFPMILNYIEESKSFVKEHGYVTTLLGRRRYLPDIESANWNLRSFAERAAINMPIQGTAADIIKSAMISIDKWMVEEGVKSRMLLQVHDELIFEIHHEELSLCSTIIEKMESAAELLVPLKVDWGMGAHWLDAHN